MIVYLNLKKMGSSGIWTRDLAPKARIIPLDQQAALCRTYMAVYKVTLALNINIFLIFYNQYKL